MKPIEVRTFKQICSMPRCQIDTKDFCLLLDNGRVYLAKKSADEMLEIPKAQFDRLVRWYMTGSIRRLERSSK